MKYFPPDAVADSPLLQKIDARIREWTGTHYDGACINSWILMLSCSPDADMVQGFADLTGFQFRAQRPSPAEAFSYSAVSGAREQNTLPISTVHVDNNMKDHRTSTVIMYITSVPDSGAVSKLLPNFRSTGRLLTCIRLCVVNCNRKVTPFSLASFRLMKMILMQL